MAREYTTDEIRTQVLQTIHTYVEYWNNLRPGEITTHDRLEGLAFSILAMLDGASGLPSFIVAPFPHPTDKAYLQNRNENWYPENDDTNINGDISGCLHELF